MQSWIFPAHLDDELFEKCRFTLPRFVGSTVMMSAKNIRGNSVGLKYQPLVGSNINSCRLDYANATFLDYCSQFSNEILNFV